MFDAVTLQAQGLSTTYSWAACHATVIDIDHDGLSDTCESAMAHTFAPLMYVQHDGTWDEGVSVGFANWPSRLGGDYAFVVQTAPENANRIRIAYLPAYYYDVGATAYIPAAAAHSGDSELILIDVEYNASTMKWETQRVFLSAHCGTINGSHCQWYNPSSFQWVDNTYQGAPIVWVSLAKHANYPSQSACNQLYVEACPDGNTSVRFPVEYQQQNAGSADYPMPYRSDWSGGRDCVPPFWGSTRLLQINSSAYTGSFNQCWWNTSATFSGWLSPFGTVPPSYGTQLSSYAGFTTGQSVFNPPPTVEPGNGVEMYGTTYAPANTTCGYYVNVTGGTAPFTYAWSNGGTAYSTNVDTHESDYSVSVIVTDATGWARSASMQATVYSAPPGTVCVMAH